MAARGSMAVKPSIGEVLLPWLHGIRLSRRREWFMVLRRLAFATIATATAVSLCWLLAVALAPGGWSGEKAALFVCFLGCVPWVGVCLGNAVLGFLILLFARDAPRAVLPVNLGRPDAESVTARTALAVTVRNEEIELVLPPLRRLLRGLDKVGAGHLFGVFVLSDTDDPHLSAAEEASVAAFRAGLPDPGRVFYRRRLRNDGFKAGNVMDFLDHHASGFELALMLDADSAMTPEAVLRLVRIMQAAPRLGLVQHLTAGCPATSAFPRLFQFGMRAGMRVWAVGQAWWQGDEGPYWGHNAIFRIAPFRAHCRLPALPGGGTILSHDQVEAAQLRAAGWSVCVWADDDGSQEANPPALPEFLLRDSRWLAGNLQYRHLLLAPALRPIGRWQLCQAMLMFATAPLQVAGLCLAALLTATGADVAQEPLLTLTFAWLIAAHSPKLAGYSETLLSPSRRALYGGKRVIAAGVAAEILFTLLLDPVAVAHRTFAIGRLALARLALGRGRTWSPQNRAERGVSWAEAARTFWPHTLLGLAAFAGFAAGSWAAVIWALPFAGGLLVSIPFCVLTAQPRISSWLRRNRIAAIPEELERLPDALTPAFHIVG
jgi:membrane glycosyltransferase